MEGVWLRWQAGTRKAVNKPNSVAGRSAVTKKMACLVYRTITPPLSRDHNRYIDIGTLPAQRTSFNTLDNWGHKIPTQSKWKRTGKKEKEHSSGAV